MFQDSSISKNNLYASSNSFEDMVEYIFSVFDQIESKLIPLEDEVVKLKFELKNYKTSYSHSKKDEMKREFSQKRNEFGFPIEVTFSAKDRFRRFSSIHEELVVAKKNFSIEFEKVVEDLLTVFANETFELKEKIISMSNPRQLIGLVNRAFECLEDQYFGGVSLDTPSQILMSSDVNYFLSQEVLFDFKKVLSTSTADYLMISAKKDEEVVGAILIEDKNRELEIKGMAVSLSQRRQGIGSNLLAEVISFSNETYSSLSVMVPETNLENQLFFKSNDFLALKTYKNYFAGGVNGYFMTRYQY